MVRCESMRIIQIVPLDGEGVFIGLLETGNLIRIKISDSDAWFSSLELKNRESQKQREDDAVKAVLSE